MDGRQLEDYYVREAFAVERLVLQLRQCNLTGLLSWLKASEAAYQTPNVAPTAQVVELLLQATEQMP
jgi:hypothetical protein